MALMARSLGLPAARGRGLRPGRVDRRRALPRPRVECARLGRDLLPRPRLADLRGDEVDQPAVRPRARRRGKRRTAAAAGIDPLLDEEIALERIGSRGISTLPSPDLVEGAIDPTRPGETDAVAAIVARSGTRSSSARCPGRALVVWLRMRQVARRWRLLPAGDRAWQQLTVAAERAGVGPRPSETIYEYAGWLEDQLPAHGEPIRTVADGKVWQAYSGRRLGDRAAHRLETAWASLRLPLVFLAVRRWLRRHVRRRSSD
jgi:hypothetical protein